MQHLKLIPQKPNPSAMKLLETMAYCVSESHTFQEWCEKANIEPKSGYLAIAKKLAFNYAVQIKENGIDKNSGRRLLKLDGNIVVSHDVVEE